ncbi:hypothetical protein [Phytohabitans kaempferiae]|uniref:Uncharacterized protein n=1 Tax=Phytohabitans kaempferiae TaxID=1620943 RepID=A0ABV6M0H2_9ACTN
MSAQPVEPGARAMWTPELVGDSYKLVADTTEELVLDRPFEIRLPVQDITP